MFNNLPFFGICEGLCGEHEMSTSNASMRGALASSPESAAFGPAKDIYSYARVSFSIFNILCKL